MTVCVARLGGRPPNKFAADSKESAAFVFSGSITVRPGDNIPGFTATSKKMVSVCPRECSLLEKPRALLDLEVLRAGGYAVERYVHRVFALGPSRLLGDVKFSSRRSARGRDRLAVFLHQLRAVEHPL